MKERETAKVVTPLIVFAWIIFTTGVLGYFYITDVSLWYVVLPSTYLAIPVLVNIYKGYATPDAGGTIEWYLAPIFYMLFVCFFMVLFYLGDT